AIEVAEWRTDESRNEIRAILVHSAAIAAEVENQRLRLPLLQRAKRRIQLGREQLSAERANAEASDAVGWKRERNIVGRAIQLRGGGAHCRVDRIRRLLAIGGAHTG